MASLKDAIQALEPKVAGHPAAMMGLAQLMVQEGRTAEALDLCRAALALAPQDGSIAAGARILLNGTVPDWHFKIIRDEARNAAYDAALHRAVRPGSRVLDIGTGTGLLAMMAGRAGAAEVIACEINPVVAQTAAEIVRRNGYGDRVRVIAKHSDQLDAEADLGGRVDVIVSEILSNNLLGENILGVHEHAVRQLLKPGGKVIPARGAARVALAYADRDDSGDLRSISRFDLSAFAALAPPARRIRVGDRRVVLRGDAADLFVFDFACAQHCAPSQASVMCRSAGGKMNGVAQWMRIELDEAVHYENRPAPGAASCWAALFYPFKEAFDTRPGQEFIIYGSHDRSSLAIWV